MTNRSLWLLTSGVSFLSSMFVLLGHLSQAPSSLTETGATLMLCLSLATLLHWIALGAPQPRRRGRPYLEDPHDH